MVDVGLIRSVGDLLEEIGIMTTSLSSISISRACSMRATMHACFDFYVLFRFVLILKLYVRFNNLSSCYSTRLLPLHVQPTMKPMLISELLRERNAAPPFVTRDVTEHTCHSQDVHCIMTLAAVTVAVTVP